MEKFSLEKYLKNPSMKVVTRDGRDVRIICTDFNNKIYPVVGEIQGVFTPEPFTKDGAYRELVCTDYDLFFAPEKHERWFNIYHCDDLGFYIRQNQPYKSKEEADEVAKANFRTFFATVKVEWEE